MLRLRPYNKNDAGHFFSYTEFTLKTVSLSGK